MFAYLRGLLRTKTPNGAVVDVGGIGYQVQIPLSTYYELGEIDDEVSLRITTQIRDEAILLYGFLTEGEQQLFHHLTSVSGVGPRIAIAMLSGMSVPEIATALADGDAARLHSIPGIGRKTAERLIVELKDRVRPLADEKSGLEAGGTSGGARADVVSALVNLGYPVGQAERAAADVLKGSQSDMPFETLLRESLRRLLR